MAPKLSEYDYLRSWRSAYKALDDKDEKTIGNNTKLVRTRNGDVRVLLHGNGILRYVRNENDIVISDGGHQSSTTKDRLNRYTPSGYSVVQRDYDWYLKTPNGRVPFENNMSLNDANRRAGSIDRRDR